MFQLVYLSCLYCLFVATNLQANASLTNIPNQPFSTLANSNKAPTGYTLGPYDWAEKNSYPTRFGPVLEGQSLWRVARKLNESAEVSVEEMMQALFRGNPSAFINGDITKLIPNSILLVPQKSFFKGVVKPVNKPLKTPASLKQQKTQNAKNINANTQRRGVTHEMHSKILQAIAGESKINASVMPVDLQKEALAPKPDRYNSSNTVPDTNDLTKKVQISLLNAIDIALVNNRSIKSIYLNRISEKLQLKIARNEFRFKSNNTIRVNTSRSGDEQERGESDSTVIENEISLKTVTGGVLSFNLNKTRENTVVNSRNVNSSYELSFRQPLLKGGGVRVNKAPLNIAQINEKINILSLKASVIDTVSATIEAYRELLRANQQLLIAKRALERSILLEKANQIQIENGRLPRKEIIQTKLEVSERKLSVLIERNNVNSARLALLNILDIDPETQITTMGEIEDIRFEPLNFSDIYTTALQSNLGYLRLQLESQVTEINLSVAKNQQLWDLDAIVSSRVDDEDNSDRRPDYFAGFELTIPLNDLQKKQGLIDAKIAIKQSDLNLLEAKESLYINVKDRINSINTLREQVKLSRQSRELAEQQLNVETIKLKQGLSSNFQVIEFEEQLIQAENNIVEANIAYLNAITGLEQFIGTTLNSWDIPFNSEINQSLLN